MLDLMMRPCFTTEILSQLVQKIHFYVRQIIFYVRQRQVAVRQLYEFAK